MGRTVNKILAKLFTRIPSLAERWVEKDVAKLDSIDAPVEAKVIEDELALGIPWTPLSKPLNECRVAIITTAGVHLKTDEPFDMFDEEGDATYREIPSSSTQKDLMITHDYYEHIDADIDVNIIFPIDRLRELEEEGVVASVAINHYGFMGHIVGSYVSKLIHETAKEVAGKLEADGVDIVVIVPG